MRASLLLVALLALPVAVHVSVAGGQSAVPITPHLAIGFSPGTLYTTADTVPVFAQGDQLWAESYYGYPVLVEVVSANGTVVANDALLSLSQALLYTFSSGDKAGSWELLGAALGSGESPSPVASFTLVGSQPVQPSMTGYRLTGQGALDMNFSLPAPGAYDIGACLVGSGPTSTVMVPLPSGLGTGHLDLVKEGNQVAVDLNGTVTAPFTFWTELHADYSYALGGSSAVVSRDLEVAASHPVDANLNFTGTTAALEDQLSMRTGRFSVWTFFESSQGLSVHETQVLIPDTDTWVSLGGCTTLANALAPTFSISSSLAQPPASWPREIYTMYKVDGVEMFSLAVIQIDPAAIHVVASPWNVTLANPVMIGSTGIPVQQFADGNDTIYLTAAQYPLEVQVGASANAFGTLPLSQPFSVYNLTIGMGKITVETNAGGKPVSGVNVVLDEGGSQLATASSVGGEATFYVLAGNYTVSGSYKNSTMTSAVEARVGVESTISLGFGDQGPFSTGNLLSYFLAFTALAGVAISVMVWVRAYRVQPKGPRLKNRPQ